MLTEVWACGGWASRGWRPGDFLRGTARSRRDRPHSASRSNALTCLYRPHDDRRARDRRDFGPAPAFVSTGHAERPCAKGRHAAAALRDARHTRRRRSSGSSCFRGPGLLMRSVLNLQSINPLPPEVY